MSKNRELQAILFKSLGNILCELPTKDMFLSFINDGLFEDIPFEGNNALVAKGCNDIVEWLKTDNAEMLVDRAYYDYMKMFVGPTNLLAAPWASVYLNKAQLVFQATTLDVREYYSHYGLEVALKNKEPDDHIGYELMFIGYLIEKGKIEPAKEFIKAHVLTWYDKWADKVNENSVTPFYSSVALIAKGCLEDFML